jgi:FMN-dependent oxidoreductase (nitrilotriacetate monooxygenase family)
MAAVTSHIGLVATVSTSHNEPYNVARRFAFLDHLSNGRAGWNIVTTASEPEARNFGANDFLPHEQRYARATEFVDVVRKLWDSWDDDAIIGDKVSGVYADKSKIHAIDHHGDFYDVAGPLNVPRSPQGHPVLFQAGASETGKSFAAKYADAIFVAAQTKDEAARLTDDIRQRAAAYGRDPSAIKILPGVLVFVGATHAQALQKQRDMENLLAPEVGASVLQELLGANLSDHPLDGPFPELELQDVPGIKSRYILLRDMALREGMTLRQVMARVASGAGHRIIAGTPSQIADDFEDWYRAGIADGFTLMWPYLPGALEDFVSLVVPELQKRGLVATEYSGTTLRDHLGLERPGVAPRSAWAQPSFSSTHSIA